MVVGVGGDVVPHGNAGSIAFAGGELHIVTLVDIGCGDTSASAAPC